MAGMLDTGGLGLEIPPEERTPLVEALLRVIQQLRQAHQVQQRVIQLQQRKIEALTDEINRLKGLPQKPQRTPQASSLNDPNGKPSEAAQKPPRTGDGKRPGSAKRSKTRLLTIHETVPLEPPDTAQGAVFRGFRDFIVQDLRVESFNTCYRRARYELPHGTFLTAPLPESVRGHFGLTLRAYVLYQHHHNQVTQPLLHEELREFGVDISVGQIDRLLTQGHEPFHADKDSLLPAGSVRKVFAADQDWEKQLDQWQISAAEPRRLVTEAALWASLLKHHLYTDLTILSDDAKQFQVLGLLHALCWVHAERHVAGLIPLSDTDRAAHTAARDDSWTFYQRLKSYRTQPTATERETLQRKFDRLFQQSTGWTELDEALRKLHDRKERLLLVLEHPQIPLHNNLSENDIRQYVKKRKISAGTRSDLGRRCRDTFLSLKTTCRKLGYRFWSYLLDRLQGVCNIPSLADSIRQRATAAPY